MTSNSRLAAGAARSVITPPLGVHMPGFFTDRTAKDIHDELYARCLVLDAGDAAVAMVNCDLIAAERADLDVARKRAAELTGLHPENILIACTHTHYGPATLSVFQTPKDEAYTAWAMERIGDAVALAWNRRAPAAIGWTRAFCPEEVHNRRWHMRDGSVRMNPGYQNPDMVRPAGPTDPELVILGVFDHQHGLMASVVNYALHYVGGPFGETISADYFGVVDQTLTRLSRPDSVHLLLNGCCGDINNCNFTQPPPEYPHPFYHVERVGRRIGTLAFAALQGVRERDAAPILRAAVEPFTFRRRHPTPEELEQARNLTAGETDAAVDRDRLYARELLLVAEEPLERESIIQALRIGDGAVVGLPGEVFVEIGLEIKQRSPFAFTQTAELANDYLGYIPPDRALAERGYETRLARSAKAAPRMERAFTKAALAALQQTAGL